MMNWNHTFVYIAIVLLAAPKVSFAQRQECYLFNQVTVTKMTAHHITYFAGLTEFMTAIELSQAQNRGFACEFPPTRQLQELDTAISWRVNKFAQSDPKLKSLFIAFWASSGQNSLTSIIAVKWLSYNNLTARFNAWDTADVHRAWATYSADEAKAVKNGASKNSLQPVSTTAEQEAAQATTLVSSSKGTMVVQWIDGDHSFGKYAVLLKGKELFRDEGLNPSVGFTYPASAPKIVVITQSVGGNSCPQHLRIVDLTGPEVQTSKDIGPCLNDDPKYAMVGNNLTIIDGFCEDRNKIKSITYVPYSVDHIGTLAIHCTNATPAKYK